MKKLLTETKCVPVTKLAKVENKLTVRFTIGVQTFHLFLIRPRTKKEVEWYKKCLDTAFANMYGEAFMNGAISTIDKIVKAEKNDTSTRKNPRPGKGNRR